MKNDVIDVGIAVFLKYMIQSKSLRVGEGPSFTSERGGE